MAALRNISARAIPSKPRCAVLALLYFVVTMLWQNVVHIVFSLRTLAQTVCELVKT